MQIRSAALTDIGKLRKQNQDRFVCDDELRLYGIADGIGGLPCGAEAAQHTITQLHAAIAATPANSLPDLAHLTQHLNDTVSGLASLLSPLGMGTTLTYALIRENDLCLAHVGDSRCYRLRDKKLTALTTDHTVENDVRRRRAAGEDVMLDESQRKSLTRCIGQRVPLEVDTGRHALQAGDRYLFCSDGIDKAISEIELSQMLGHGDDPQAILSALINLANNRGGTDNATGVIVIVDEI